MIGLGFQLGGKDEEVYGVSDDGSIMVGRGHRQGYWAVAYRWTENGGKDYFLGLEQPSSAQAVSSDGSVIVGYTYPDDQHESLRQAFHWTETTGLVELGDLDGGVFHSRALGVSSDGSAIVGFGNSDSGNEAFRWTESEGMVGLGDLPGGDFFSWAYDVSADGSVVVGESATDFALGSEAFIWDADNGMQNLNELLDDYGLDLTGWTLTSAKGISADGLSIVGHGINPDGNVEAWIATIPEPATISLFFIGAILLRRRRAYTSK